MILLSSDHNAHVEEKPEVRKAGGVYYTPTYVVDYIIKHTIGKLVEGATPGQVAKLKVLDPACGSGSFLIAAYQYLLDWHLDYYLADGVENHRKQVYQGLAGVWHLTTDERKQILLRNIYGVDIDSQAVEVTKLSLLLKVLEGETSQSLETQLRLFHERALPDLSRNIKCGNTLIGSDFYNTQQASMFDEEQRYHINVFEWAKEFPAILKAGGFDAVIGNPPWGAQFTEPELVYLRQNYREVINRMIDSYIYFINRAIQLTVRDGMIGFVIPSTLLNQVDAKAVRQILLERGLRTLISLGKDIFTTKVLNTSTIFISAPQEEDGNIALADVSALPLLERKTAIEKTDLVSWGEWKELVGHDPHYTYFVSKGRSSALLDRLRQEHILLKQIIQGEIQRGVSPDVVAAHVLTRAEAEEAKLEDVLLRPSVSGGETVQ